MLTLSQICRAAGKSGKEDEVKKWAQRARDVGNGCGLNSRNALVGLVSEADGYRGLKQYQKAVDMLQSGENIAKEYPLMNMEDMSNLMKDAGEVIAGMQGKIDPLKGFINSSVVSAHFDYFMFLNLMAEFYMDWGKMDEATDCLTKGMAIVKNGTDSMILKSIYSAKIMELISKYPDHAQKLQELGMQIMQ